VEDRGEQLVSTHFGGFSAFPQSNFLKINILIIPAAFVVHAGMTPTNSTGNASLEETKLVPPGGDPIVGVAQHLDHSTPGGSTLGS
jgi:hypothetical protein